MPLYLSEKDAARLAAGQAPKATQTAPRAPREARTGLGPLLVAGWNIEWRGQAMRVRLWRADKDTGWHDTLKAACERAKELI